MPDLNSIAAPTVPNGTGSEKGYARIAIDRGGTFTDAICSRPDEEDIVIKVSRRDSRMGCILPGRSQIRKTAEQMEAR